MIKDDGDGARTKAAGSLRSEAFGAGVCTEGPRPREKRVGLEGVSDCGSQGLLWVTRQQEPPASRPTHTGLWQLFWREKKNVPGVSVGRYFQHRPQGS